ncbi:hypothetical protein PYCCODRAFT_764074 [Trametes coccinea BRFM310]|uniref:Uncharacterized protein n=1 Tax=Trametes coccinea (strain BRFM310) TaxID=1353009 RepID=A0A1Y2J081_TRAC3|nr:hypothetical protein PYCCODRAFT_764074 [Trametes coccinea BRFM310]
MGTVYIPAVLSVHRLPASIVSSQRGAVLYGAYPWASSASICSLQRSPRPEHCSRCDIPILVSARLTAPTRRVVRSRSCHVFNKCAPNSCFYHCGVACAPSSIVAVHSSAWQSTSPIASPAQNMCRFRSDLVPQELTNGSAPNPCQVQPTLLISHLPAL